MTTARPIHVVGIGLEGASGLDESRLNLLAQATLLVGSDRHLSYFPDHSAQKMSLGNIKDAIASIQSQIEQYSHDPSDLSIVILVSGDPLFFGLGRLLLQYFAPEMLSFHPHLSSMQLAFSRIKVPWQDATLISLHGRTPEVLVTALKQGQKKIAVLTDTIHTPEAIAQLIQTLRLPVSYRIWVCENLGGFDEQVKSWDLNDLALAKATDDKDKAHSQMLHQQSLFAPLNIVILIQERKLAPLDLTSLPIIGLADGEFASFRDRPGLMTKQEIRTLALGALQLQPKQTVWDIGAGTGAVSIEIARLSPTSQVYAVEKTAAGINLIEANTQRFETANVIPIHGVAPDVLQPLPPPERIFIGGSGGHLISVLDHCALVLRSGGLVVLAIATLEHQAIILQWLQRQSGRESDTIWHHQSLAINLARSTSIAALTRMSPMNPVTLMILKKGTLGA